MSSSSCFRILERQIEGDARRHAFGERVGLDPPSRAFGARQDRAKASARSACTPMTRGAQTERRAHEAAAARAAAAADRHEDHVGRPRLEDLERVGRDAGNQQRLVRGVDVAQSARAALPARPPRAPRRSRGRTRSRSAPNARIAAFLSGLLPTGTIDRARDPSPGGRRTRSTGRGCRCSR